MFLWPRCVILPTRTETFGRDGAFHPLDESHHREALRYTELNPVRASMVANAEGWEWSSGSRSPAEIPILSPLPDHETLSMRSVVSSLLG
jgi:hypothetical protein